MIKRLSTILRRCVIVVGLFMSTVAMASLSTASAKTIDKEDIYELLSVYFDQPSKLAKVYSIISNTKYSAVVDCEELVGTRTALGGVWVDYIPEKADLYHTTPMMRLIYINLDRGISVLHIPNSACSIRNPSLPGMTVTP